MDRKRIEDIIAEARAEEELIKEERKDAGLRQAIKNTLDEHSPKVSIDLKEYVELKQKDKDLERILHAVLDCMGLNYTGDDLMIKDDRPIQNVIKSLYPAAYDAILAAEMEFKMSSEQEEGL